MKFYEVFKYNRYNGEWEGEEYYMNKENAEKEVARIKENWANAHKYPMPVYERAFMKEHEMKD